MRPVDRADRGGRPRGEPAGSEPFERGPADRGGGPIAKDQAVPGAGLLEQAHALAQVGEPAVEVWVGLESEGPDRVGLLVERADLLECGLVALVSAFERLGLGDRPDLAERTGQAIT